MAVTPVCVRRSNSVEEADIVVAWLNERGVQATIVDRDNPGVFAFGPTDMEGIAICVADEAEATRAKALLEEHDRELQSAAPDPDATTDVTCDECGQTASLPVGAPQTVRECPSCGAYLELPPSGSGEA